MFGAVSCANQAAAFDKMSRSTFSCRFSRRSRVSSVRSAVVRPSVRRPASRSAWATQLLIDCAVGSNSPAEVLGGTSGSDQRDQLFAKLRRIRSSGSWHRGLLLPQGLGVHESGSGPDLLLDLNVLFQLDDNGLRDKVTPLERFS